MKLKQPHIKKTPASTKQDVIDDVFLLILLLYRVSVDSFPTFDGLMCNEEQKLLEFVNADPDSQETLTDTLLKAKVLKLHGNYVKLTEKKHETTSKYNLLTDYEKLVFMLSKSIWDLEPGCGFLKFTSNQEVSANTSWKNDIGLPKKIWDLKSDDYSFNTNLETNLDASVIWPRKSILCFGYNSNWMRRTTYLLQTGCAPIKLLTLDLNPDKTYLKSKTVSFFQFARTMVLAGSVNGIVCLNNSKEDMRKYVALWNPSMMFWKLISSPAAAKNVQYYSLGFGYVGSRRDYRIVCIIPVSRGRDVTSSRVAIYSVNGDVWVEVENVIPLYAVPSLRCNFEVDGIPFWEGRDDEVEGSNVLACIDPRNGSYKSFKYPDHENYSRIYPVNFLDSAAVVIRNELELDLYQLDVKTSEWTKLHSIKPVGIQRPIDIPQCFNGKIIIITPVDRIFHFCDPMTGHTHRIKDIEELNVVWYGSFSHGGSLECPNGMTICKELNQPVKKK